MPQQRPAEVPAAPRLTAASPHFRRKRGREGRRAVPRRHPNARREHAAGLAVHKGHPETAVRVLGLGGLGWVFKGSVGSRSRDMPLSELLGVLDSAEKEQREFCAVIDLR